ncbi:MAG: pyridoxal-dependent decarboxylase [Bacteroidota bacterium]|nr:pyridoxal-dependent decarboxylase [Bacteroidota bacterium]
MLHTEKPSSIRFAKHLLKAHLNEPEETRIKLSGESGQVIEAFFPGTRGDNFKYMQELLGWAIQGNIDSRKNYFPGDPDYIDKEIQNSEEFIKTLKMMGFQYELLINQLKGSGAFFSPRTIGHMLWDTTLPGILGYFAALLYNQNNVAAEASPVTTIIEMYVGNELCKMLGYAINPIGKKPGEFSLPDNLVTGWGHITCDGSVANLEGLWMARNLKFYPVSVRAAISDAVANKSFLDKAKDFQVTLLDGSKSTLISLDDWTILNLPVEEVLGMYHAICTQYYKTNNDKTTQENYTKVSNAIADYSVQNIGYHDILSKYLPTIKQTPVSLCSATRHYSWPKGAAILGIGANNMICIQVDKKARMDINDLRKNLDNCLQHKKPLMNVVAIIGTTEESAVDPLKCILAVRDEYRKKGLEFAIHADAAWGGYYKTMLNSNDESNDAFFTTISQEKMMALPMSDYVKEQYLVLQQADSITIDPHKSGYVPYPAGGLCYRNSAMRNLVSFTAPVVYHGGVDPTVGVYGVEGSKPGAAATAVYFSHTMIRPNTSGYGKISGECYFNTKRLYAAMVCLNIEKLSFFFVPLVPIPAIQQGKSPADVQKQYEFIRDRIVNKTNEQLINDAEAFGLFKELGGDQTIVTYMYNYYCDDGKPNTDMTKVNELNDAVYRAFSFSEQPGEEEHVPEIVVTSSSFTRGNYGNTLMDDLRLRLGVTNGYDDSINFIISTIMNPWLSNTVKGSFIPELISILTRNVNKVVATVKTKPIPIS